MVSRMDKLARRQRPRRYAGQSYLREYAVLAGLCPSAQVMTDDGPVPLEWIGRGDLVLTRNAGYQPVLWTEKTQLTETNLRDVPELGPALLLGGSLGPDSPSRDITMSPTQLVFVDREAGDPDADGVLIPAHMLCETLGQFEDRAPACVTYVSLLLNGHHLIEVEGVWVGSLFTADLGAEFDASDPLLAEMKGHVMQPAAQVLRRSDVAPFLASREARREKKSA